MHIETYIRGRRIKSNTFKRSSHRSFIKTLFDVPLTFSTTLKSGRSRLATAYVSTRLAISKTIRESSRSESVFFEKVTFLKTSKTSKSVFFLKKCLFLKKRVFLKKREKVLDFIRRLRKCLSIHILGAVSWRIMHRCMSSQMSCSCIPNERQSLTCCRLLRQQHRGALYIYIYIYI